MCVDLDGFKIINDTLGHPAGDRLLVAVAHGLRDAVRSPDIVARIGGDEFVVLLPGARRDEAAAVARRIVARLREPISVGDGEPITVDSTVGIAFGPADGVTADMLLSRADQALYAAKRAGGGRYCIYGQSAAGQSPSALS
jgi:diguanylate cyclase (GGDEF)-like protein